MSEFYEKVGTQMSNRAQGDAIEAAPSQKRPAPDRPPGHLTIRRWSQADDVFWPASETVQRLEPAFYRFDELNLIGPCLRKATITTDGLIHLPDTVGETIVAEFKTFWALRERFTARGFLHKRGILLWGPPGSGKTCTLMLMADEIIRNQGGIVCLIENPGLAAVCLQFIRKIEPERPIVALIEDLDSLVEHHREAGYLALLDGDTQVDRICYIATTNYPERLDRRFVDRPSRFDTVEFIGMPSAAARSVYLEAKDPELTGYELAQWVAATDGFSVAHLRELIILVRCFDRPLEQAVERLEAMRIKPSSERAPDRQTFGIAPGRPAIERPGRTGRSAS